MACGTVATSAPVSGCTKSHFPELPLAQTSYSNAWSGASGRACMRMSQPGFSWRTHPNDLVMRRVWARVPSCNYTGIYGCINVVMENEHSARKADSQDKDPGYQPTPMVEREGTFRALPQNATSYKTPLTGSVPRLPL